MLDMSRRCIVLLSGGLDSATVLAIARHQQYEVSAISFRYGQRHAFEIECARQQAATQQVERHVFIDFDLRQFSGSALTSELAVPKHDFVEQIGQEIPVTYVPARNTIFLSFALAFAESIAASDIFLGVNALDYSGYPDCRPAYLTAFENMANLATKQGVEGEHPFRIHAPLIDMTKSAIIRRGLSLGVNYAMTTSCYDPNRHGHACGQCDACLLRLKGFTEAGMSDPVKYQTIQ
jgi:7-cyano-7-deazaguanine synthase